MKKNPLTCSLETRRRNITKGAGSLGGLKPGQHLLGWNVILGSLHRLAELAELWEGSAMPGQQPRVTLHGAALVRAAQGT